MAQAINRLSAAAIKNARKDGLYADGNGLYLQVSKTGTKSWSFRFTLNGKARQMGLGPLNELGLKDARDEAIGCRALLRDGIDPIEDREARRSAAQAETAKVQTFKYCAREYIRGQSSAWKNVKHGKQWTRTLETYVYPTIGALPVDKVDTPLIVQILTPIWHTKTETASRVRGRIESILDWAAVSGFRQGENPARWRGHLDKMFPKRSRVKPVKHYPSLPYPEMPKFMEALTTEEGHTITAFTFAVLTASRTGEVIGARWDEFDLQRKIWTIPAERMKAKKEHRVALSDKALELIQSLPVHGDSPYVFPGRRVKKPMSNMAFIQILKRLGYSHVTPHGFRSTFRDWVSEATGYPSEVAEMALAHSVSDKVEAAYRRGDLLQKRFNLMDDWAGYCHSPPLEDEENVVPLSRAK